MKLNTQRVVDFLSQGREIEFSFSGKKYFLAPLYQDEKFTNQYYIFDCNEKSVIFTGTLQKVLAYEFALGASLEKSSELFSIEYVL